MAKIMGSLKIVCGLVWIGLFVVFLIYGQRGFEGVEKKLLHTLLAADQNIEDIDTLMFEIMDVMSMLDQSLSTIEETIIDASIALGETHPILDETSKVVADEIPDALDEVQDALPGVIEAAAVIDSALTILSGFNYEIPKPLSADKWVISLGVNYNPAVPLDQALQNLGDKLEGIPANLRGIEGDLANAKVNLAIISDDLIVVAADLGSIREQVNDVNPRIEMLRSNLVDGQNALEELQDRIPQAFETGQKWFVGVMILAILSQIPSIYVGWMVTRRAGISA